MVAGAGWRTLPGPGREPGRRRPGGGLWSAAGAFAAWGVGVGRVNEGLAALVAVGPAAASGIPVDAALGMAGRVFAAVGGFAGEAAREFVHFLAVLGVRLRCATARQASVGEYETGAAIHRGVGGTHGVAARGNVVHEIDLAAAKAPKRGFEAVRVGRGFIGYRAGEFSFFDWRRSRRGVRLNRFNP